MRTFVGVLFGISVWVCMVLGSALISFLLYYLIGLMISGIFPDQASAFQRLSGLNLEVSFAALGTLLSITNHKPKGNDNA